MDEVWTHAIGLVVVALGHFCRWEWDEEGEKFLRYFHDFEEAAEFHPCMLEVDGVKTAWTRATGLLWGADVEAVEPEVPVSWRVGCPEGSREVRCNVDALMGLAKSMTKIKEGKEGKWTVDQWQERLREATGGVEGEQPLQ